MAKPVCWVVTDGRAGIESQALGLAEAVAEIRPMEIVVKRIGVRSPWRELPWRAWGEALGRLSSASDRLDPPFPELWIGCGRLSVPFAVSIKKRAPETFTVQLQNPRAPSALSIMMRALSITEARALSRIIGSSSPAAMAIPMRKVPRSTRLNLSRNPIVILPRPAALHACACPVQGLRSRPPHADIPISHVSTVTHLPMPEPPPSHPAAYLARPVGVPVRTVAW